MPVHQTKNYATFSIFVTSLLIALKRRYLPLSFAYRCLLHSSKSNRKWINIPPRWLTVLSSWIIIQMPQWIPSYKIKWFSLVASHSITSRICPLSRKLNKWSLQLHVAHNTTTVLKLAGGMYCLCKTLWMFVLIKNVNKNLKHFGKLHTQTFSQF